MSWVAIVLLALAVSSLLGRVRMLARRDQGAASPAGLVGRSLHAAGSSLGVDAPAPAGTLDLLDGRASIFVFLDRACATCDRLIGPLQAFGREHTDWRFVAAYRGEPPSIDPPISVMGNAEPLFRSLRIALTPFVVAVDAAGVVRVAARVGSVEQLEAVVDEATGRRRVVDEHADAV